MFLKCTDKKDNMNVLSLFDGMACGLVALKRAGIRVDNYFASEIDKYAIKIAKKNHPEIQHLGSIEDYESWNLPSIDLIIAGPPCQGFSIAGKGLNWDDPRSQLFFKAIEILWKYNPRYFLFENVASMKKDIRAEIDELMEVDSVLINSALVSAQNRKRLYWCNWKIKSLVDKSIYLSDITEKNVDEKYNLKTPVKGIKATQNLRKGLRLPNEKSKALTAGGQNFRNNGATNLIFKLGIENGIRLHDGKFLSRNFREGYRVYSEDGKTATLTAKSKGGPGGYSGLYEIKGKIRKLTPIECERLQTLPGNYTEGVSNTQRYKMIGNGWTVDVVAHILKSLTN